MLTPPPSKKQKHNYLLIVNNYNQTMKDMIKNNFKIKMKNTIKELLLRFINFYNYIKIY